MRAVQKGAFSPDLSRAEQVAQALAESPEKFQHLPETGPDDLPEGDPAEENVSEAGTDLSVAEELLRKVEGRSQARHLCTCSAA